MSIGQKEMEKKDENLAIMLPHIVQHLMLPYLIAVSLMAVNIHFHLNSYFQVNFQDLFIKMLIVTLGIICQGNYYRQMIKIVFNHILKY
jgi:hypothetical protein